MESWSVCFFFVGVMCFMTMASFSLSKRPSVAIMLLLGVSQANPKSSFW